MLTNFTTKTPTTTPTFLLGWAYAIIWVATIVAFLGAVALW
jgi:cytochrome c biogenesis protein CcdA